jgi:DHA1 family bicyclomycin/chloramphenicol resistance-like MFS transporter
MARIMSFVMVVFILTPAIAPSYGKFMLDSFNWESIFISQIFIAIVITLWFSFRQKETLKANKRVRFNSKLYLDGAKFFIQSRQALFYTIILGVMQGGFLTFLSTAQNVLGEQYGLENEFPLLFAGIALVIGASTLLNGILVVKLGMNRLIMTASVFYTLVALIYILFFSGQSNPNIYILVGFLSVLFLGFGFIFGNLSSLAMEPLGKIAGIGSAIHGFLSTIISVPIAGFIGSFLKGTAYPLMTGFFVTGFVSVVLLVYLWISKRQDV